MQRSQLGQLVPAVVVEVRHNRPGVEELHTGPVVVALVEVRRPTGHELANAHWSTTTLFARSALSNAMD